MLEEKIAALTEAVEALTRIMSLAHASPSTTSHVDGASEAPVAATDAAGEEPSEQDVKDLTLAMSRAGHKNAIRDKLMSFDARKLSDLTSPQTAEFFAWLHTLQEG